MADGEHSYLICVPVYWVAYVCVHKIDGAIELSNANRKFLWLLYSSQDTCLTSLITSSKAIS